MPKPIWRGSFAVKVVAVAAAYYGTAKFGLALAYDHDSITAVWPPTGIALAALLIWGIRFWPGVALGALLANLWTGIPIESVAGITLGNTLEAVVATLLLTRVHRINLSLDRLKDVTALVGYGALLSTVVSATIGVASLKLGGVLNDSELLAAWRTWWLGDLGGDILVAPLLLVIADDVRRRRYPGRTVEAFLLLAFTTAVTLVVFTNSVPLSYLVFPLIMWAAVRFSQRGATLSAALVAGVATWATASGVGPFVVESLDTSLIISQTFIGVACATGLVVAAASSERTAAKFALQVANEDLEIKVQMRTAELRIANEQADRAKAKFFSAVSHELRTPLTAIIGCIQRLQNPISGDLNERQQRLLHIMERNSARQLRLVGDLLFAGSADHGEFSIEPKFIDLDAAVLEAVEAALPAADEREVTLDFHERTGIQLWADFDRLVQLVENLVSNALKFTPKGGRVTVFFESGGDDGTVGVRIHNTGTFIEPDEIERLFERFFRTANTTQAVVPGIGLGLSIAKTIAEAHGGEISVESDELRGTTFTVALPILSSPSPALF